MGLRQTGLGFGLTRKRNGRANPIPAMPVTFKGDFDADAGGANAITVSGVNVETWPNNGSIDKASATLINNGGANRPALVTADADFNGHNSVLFSGGQHLYDNAHSLAEAMMNVGSKHCFLVLSVGTYAANRCIFNDGNNLFALVIDADGDGLAARNNDGSTDTTPNISVPAVSTPCLVEVLHTGGNLSLKVANGSYQTVASGNTSAMGTYFEVGHIADGAGTKFSGKIARMIFHDTVLTGQDLLDVRENLGRNYGVSYI